jgi:hypothetical protein
VFYFIEMPFKATKLVGDDQRRASPSYSVSSGANFEDGEWYVDVVGASVDLVLPRRTRDWREFVVTDRFYGMTMSTR